MIFLILTCGNQWFLDSRNLAFWTKHDSCHGRSTICCGNRFGLATCCWSNGLWSLNATEFRCRSTSKRRWIVRSAWHGSGRGSIAFGYFVETETTLEAGIHGYPILNSSWVQRTCSISFCNPGFNWILPVWLHIQLAMLANTPRAFHGHITCADNRWLIMELIEKKKPPAETLLGTGMLVFQYVLHRDSQLKPACWATWIHMVNTWWTLARHFQTQYSPLKGLAASRFRRISARRARLAPLAWLKNPPWRTMTNQCNQWTTTKITSYNM